MLIAAAALAIGLQSTFTLERGAPSQSDLHDYAVSDTFLDSQAPMANYGRDMLLSGGQGKVILIRFDELWRCLGNNVLVGSASLNLHQEIGEKPQLSGAYLVTTDWGEGSGRRGQTLLAPQNEPGSDSEAIAASWSKRFGGKNPLSWNSPGGDGLADRTLIQGVEASSDKGVLTVAGLGPTVQKWLDKPYANFGIALIFKNTVDFRSSEAPSGKPQLVVQAQPGDSGPGADVEVKRMAPSGEPAGSPAPWTASIHNSGNASSGRINAEIWVRGEKVKDYVIDDLAPSADSTIEFMVDQERKSWDDRRETVELILKTGNADIDETNNYSIRPINGLRTSIAADRTLLPTFEQEAKSLGFSSIDAYFNRLVNDLNFEALNMSRFSVTPSGSRTLIRLDSVNFVDLKVVRVTASTWIIDPDSSWHPNAANAMSGAFASLVEKAGVPRWTLGTNDAFAGLMGGGDTRNDSEMPGVLGIVSEPWYDPISPPMGQPTGLFSATDMALLQAKRDNPKSKPSDFLPKGVVLRILGTNNQMVKSAEMMAFEPGNDQPIFAAASTDNGAVRFSRGESGAFPKLGEHYENGAIQLEFRKFGVTAVSNLTAWQLIDSYFRGNKDAAIIPVRIALPEAQVDMSVNQAQGKLTTSENNSDLAALAAITDGNPQTTYTWKPGGPKWIEIDLGKDRLVGCVRIQCDPGQIWDQFGIRVYETGMTAAAARPWAAEASGRTMLVRRGNADHTAIDYFGSLNQARYIRFELSEAKQPCTIREITVHPYTSQ